ncbi:MAG: hypothetical protein LBJ82_00145 [Deltaproteobacteria bacterium]|jgi:hypothetical protein|nr:hypothetical protein [Deltaproteobacteria bacterium]
MTSLLIILGIAVLCVAAMRLAKPEYYSPRCCMGLAVQAIKEAQEKERREACAPEGTRPETD